LDSVGQILKKNREIKKLKISEVSKELNISETILNNFENDYNQENLDIVFMLGHLRSYIGYLDLDQKELIDKFKDQHFMNQTPSLEIKRPIDKKNVIFSNKVISFTLIVIIFSSFYLLFIQVEKPKREYALIPDLPENYISTIEEATVFSSSVNSVIKNDENNNLAKIDNTSSSTSANASLVKNENYKSTLTLKFLEDTWFQLRDVNDEIILSQLMNKNDEYSYDIDLNYSITSGNAGHIMVIIDQKVKGKLGKKGQVVDSLV
jgi:hypothetical protein